MNDRYMQLGHFRELFVVNTLIMSSLNLSSQNILQVSPHSVKCFTGITTN